MRVALIDLDDTLLDYQAEEKHGRDAVHRQCLSQVPEQVWADVYRQAKDEQRRRTTIPHESSHLRRLELALTILSSRGLAGRSDAAFARYCTEVYWSARYCSVRCLPGAAALIRTLRLRSDRVLLCTSGASAHQERRVRIAGLGSAFDAVITSEGAGAEKDDWPAFLGEHWVCGNEYVVVSDCYEPDLAAALRCGMRAGWIRPAHRRIPYPADAGRAIRWIAATPGELAELIEADVMRGTP